MFFTNNCSLLNKVFPGITYSNVLKSIAQASTTQCGLTLSDSLTETALFGTREGPTFRQPSTQTADFV